MYSRAALRPHMRRRRAARSSLQDAGAKAPSPEGWEGGVSLAPSAEPHFPPRAVCRRQFVLLGAGVVVAREVRVWGTSRAESGC